MGVTWEGSDVRRRVLTAKNAMDLDTRTDFHVGGDDAGED
jgi:hypothetical protein